MGGTAKSGTPFARRAGPTSAARQYGPRPSLAGRRDDRRGPCSRHGPRHRCTARHATLDFHPGGSRSRRRRLRADPNRRRSSTSDAMPRTLILPVPAEHPSPSAAGGDGRCPKAHPGTKDLGNTRRYGAKTDRSRSRPCLHDTQEVTGSTPVTPTTFRKVSDLQLPSGRCDSCCGEPFGEPSHLG